MGVPKMVYIAELSTDSMHTAVSSKSASAKSPSMASALLMTGKSRRRLRRFYTLIPAHSQKVTDMEAVYPCRGSGAPSLIPKSLEAASWPPPLPEHYIDGGCRPSPTFRRPMNGVDTNSKASDAYFHQPSILCLPGFGEPPKRAKSAYTLFYECEMEKLDAEGVETISYCDVIHHVARGWKDLSAPRKAKFEEIAMNDRARYLREVEEYKLRARAQMPFDGNSVSLIHFPSFTAYSA